MRPVPLVPLLLASALLPGCSLACLFAVDGAGMNESSYPVITPAGPLEQRLAVSAAPAAPNPLENAPIAAPPPEPAPTTPRPGPITIILPPEAAPGPSPEQLVGPPLGTKPLGLRCETESRASLEDVENHIYVWGAVTKVVAGFLMVADGAMPLAYALGGVRDSPTMGAMAAFGLADFLGNLALILFKQGEWRVENGVGPGTWRPQPGPCPAGLKASSETVGALVSPEGAIAPEADARLVRDLVLTPSELVLSLGGLSQTLPVPLETRCALARDRHLPPPPRCPPRLAPELLGPVYFPVARAGAGLGDGGR